MAQRQVDTQQRDVLATRVEDDLHPRATVIVLGDAGPQTTVQDLGRRGHLRYGIAPSGPLDRDAFDLLITDIVMPSLDGIGLALKVAKDFPALPVLLMTGYSAERQRAHNLEELICEVITKPFTLQEICEAAEAALTAEPMTCH